MFTSFLSILVNGSPTADFVVERGLRKEDHFPPFLFVLVTEGLVGLIRKVVNICAFSGFQVFEQTRKKFYSLQMILFSWGKVIGRMFGALNQS